MRAQPQPATSRKLAPVIFPQLDLAKLDMLFANGQRVWLYQVGADWLMRTFEHEGDTLQVDLRTMLPADVEADMMDATETDRAGVLFFELRLRYRTAEVLLQALLEECRPADQRLAA